MRRFRPACLAAVSALVWTCVADAARPRYGGTLRVETSASMRTLDPAATPVDAADASSRHWLHPLMFETLVGLEGPSGLSPRLAVSWTSNAELTDWQFHLRSGVKLHDGSALDAGRVAAALRAINRSWSVTGDSGVVTIRVDQPRPDLPWQLAETRYAIAFGRPEGGEPIGTGPFAIDRWEPRRLRLRAHEDHWAGRPFLDAVQIEMGRPVGDQLASLEAGRADVVAIQPQDARRVTQRGFQVAATRHLELVAVVLNRGVGSSGVRRALSLAIDRASICGVLLQGNAQPAWTVLPQWLGGYAALFAAGHDPARARALIGGEPAARRTLLLVVNEADLLLRAIRDRIAVNARDAGLSIVSPSTGGAAPRSPDATLVRLRLRAGTPAQAMTAAIVELDRQTRTHAPLPQLGSDPAFDAIYRFERDAIESGAIVPIAHLPDLYAMAPAVESWRAPIVLPSGAWNLANAWLRGSEP